MSERLCVRIRSTLRSLASNARSPAHANRSIGERNSIESTALLAPLMELKTCDSDCARPPCDLPRPQPALTLTSEWGRHQAIQSAAPTAS